MQANAQVRADDFVITDTKSLRELLIRNGLFLPDINSKWCTRLMLIAVRNKTVFAFKQSQIIYRVCTRPPSVKCLVKKYQWYADQQGLNTGINMALENFPDKEYLILGIAAFSNGTDEIFQKNYIPKAEDLKRQPVEDLMLDNSDGLFDNVNPLMFKGKKGRRLNLTAMSSEDKLNVRALKK